MEEGDGDIRDPYLKQHLVKTYFVINPKVSIIKSLYCNWPMTSVIKRQSTCISKWFQLSKSLPLKLL